MLHPYLNAAADALRQLQALLQAFALPLAIAATVPLAALAYFSLRRARAAGAPGFRPWLRRGALALLALGLWGALGAVAPEAREALRLRESAEATVEARPDAPPILQYGPALSVLKEKTYTRTLTMPPGFLERLTAEGVGALTPYLTDPSAENVLRMVDSFRRSGADVVFTRAMTRRDEEPLPFSDSQVNVRFSRLGGRAYDADFQGRYFFRNSSDQPIEARLWFTLPDAGTVRDLVVVVDGKPVAEPNANGTYEWTGKLAAGERKEATIRYRAAGTRVWRYDLGSSRRRVERLQLSVDAGGRVGFLRGSLFPGNPRAGTLRWDLANVVTQQQVALSFPPDLAPRETYLQALAALPAALLAFLAGLWLCGTLLRRPLDGLQTFGAVAIFGLGLGATRILADYAGAPAGVLIAPLLATAAIARLLGARTLLAALPAALLPATFLSPTHTGLLALLLAIATLVGYALCARPAAAPEPSPTP